MTELVRSLLNHGADRWCLWAVEFLGSALRQVDLAAEGSIVFHRQPKGANISFYIAASAQLDATAGNKVAVDLSHNQNVLCCEVSGNACIGTDGQSALSEDNGALHSPLHDQVFASLYVATYHHGFADTRWSIFCCHDLIPPGVALA